MTRQIWQRRIRTILRRSPWLVWITFKFWRWLQPKYTLGAVGILPDNTGRILLVEHTFHPKVPWGLPGGWVNRLEEPAEAVRREMYEELSLKVEVGPVILVDTPFPNHIDMAFLCRTSDSVGALSYELVGYEWFTAEDLPRLLKFHYRAIQRALEMLEQTELQVWLHH